MNANDGMNHIKTTPNRSIILFGIALLFFLNLFFLLYVSRFLKLMHIGFGNLFYISCLFMWVNLIVILFYSQKFEKQEFLLWSEKRYPLLYYIKSIIVIMLIFIVGAIIIGIALRLLGYNPNSKKLEDIVNLLHNNKLLTIFASLTAGVTEELIFRGYLVPRLQLFFKKSYPTIIISSVLFGILHINYGTISQIIIPTFMGFVFAVHYQKYRSIKILIICHFLWDLSMLLILTH